MDLVWSRNLGKSLCLALKRDICFCDSVSHFEQAAMVLKSSALTRWARKPGCPEATPGELKWGWAQGWGSGGTGCPGVLAQV